MDTAGAALPELDGFGYDAVSAPEGGERDFAVLEFGFYFLEFLEEDFFGGYDFGLVRNPCADLGFAGAGHKVFEGFRGGDFFRNALDDDLAFEGDPWEKQADFGVALDVLGFAGLVVGEKGEAFLIESFEQHSALRGKVIWSEGGERHGVRLRDIEFGSLLEPVLEKLDGIVAHVLTLQTFGGVFFSEIG